MTDSTSQKTDPLDIDLGADYAATVARLRAAAAWCDVHIYPRMVECRWHGRGVVLASGAGPDLYTQVEVATAALKKLEELDAVKAQEVEQ